MDEIDFASVGGFALSDSSKITVDTKTLVARLKTSVSNLGEFCPLDADISVTTRVLTPGKHIGWRALQVSTDEPLDEAQNADTDVKMKLTDGTTDRYWDGAAWSVAGASDWASIEDTVQNFTTYPGLGVGFILNLSTLDKRLTPTVSRIKFLFDVDVASFKNDLIYNTIVKQMKDEIRPLSDFFIAAWPGGSSFDTNTLDFDDEFKITDIDAVWDLTTEDPVNLDPNVVNPKTDLLDTFTSGTGVFTTTSPITAGNKVLVRARYAPQVGVDTNTDYVELSKVPSIMITTIDEENLGEVAQDDFIMNVFTDPPSGIICKAPRWAHFVFGLTISAGGSVDLGRLAEALEAFLDERRTITSDSTGRAHTLRITDSFIDTTTPNNQNLRTGSMAFRVENVYKSFRAALVAGSGAPGAEFAFGVKQVNTDIQIGTASVSVQIGG